MTRPWSLRRLGVYSVVLFYTFSLVTPYVAGAYVQTRGCDGCTETTFVRSPEDVSISGGCSDCTYEEPQEKMAAFFSQFEKLRSNFDKTSFDPKAMANAIGPNLKDLFSFVWDEIAYQPYQGGLRMAQGTLMSRAGNSMTKVPFLQLC